MSEKEKAPAGAATPTGANERDLSCSISQVDNTSFSGARQVSAYLLHGQENAIPARELATIVGFNGTRALREAVERERRAGVLILSSDRGYFLPSTDEDQATHEIAAFVQRADARMMSNRQSVCACKRWLRRHRQREIEGQAVLFDEVGV